MTDRKKKELEGKQQVKKREVERRINNARKVNSLKKKVADVWWHEKRN